MRGCVLLGASIVLSLVAIGAVRAQPTNEVTPERTAQARELFSRGRELATAERWADAADLFRRALALRSSPAIRYNLGVSLLRGEHVLEASEQLRQVAGAEDAPPDIRVAAQGLLAALRQRVGHIRIDVTAHGVTFEVRLDGRPLPTAIIGTRALIDPGSHRLTLHVDGRIVARRSVRVDRGQTLRVNLTFRPPTQITTATAPNGTVHGDLPLAFGVAASVAGAVAVGLSILSLTLQLDLQDQIRRYEADPTIQRVQDLNARADLVEGLNATADGFWLGTVAAAVVAIVLEVTNAPNERPSAVSLTAAPTNSGLMLGATWQLF